MGSKCLTYQGSRSDYEIDVLSKTKTSPLLTDGKKVCPLGSWLSQYLDITVIGDDFTRNYTCLYRHRDKTTNKFRMEFIYE